MQYTTHVRRFVGKAGSKIFVVYHCPLVSSFRYAFGRRSLFFTLLAAQARATTEQSGDELTAAGPSDKPEPQAPPDHDEVKNTRSSNVAAAVMPGTEAEEPDRKKVNNTPTSNWYKAR